MPKQMLLFDREVLRGKFLDGLTPGYAAEFDPYEAEAAGAFVERALDEDDALASSVDALTLELFP